MDTSSRFESRARRGWRAALVAFAMLVSVDSAQSTPAPPPPIENPTMPGEGVAGSWLGTLQAGTVSLRLALDVSEANGLLAGVLNSIDQGSKIPLSAITADATSVQFECAMINGRFIGKFAAGGSELSGTWSQGQSSLPLTFKRLKKPFALARPQNPVRPYAYREEEVAISNKSADVTLAGTLTLPRGTGPFPAVVLMTGSGPQDRDEALAGHKPFLVLADHLTRAGIAVLRYDDRGFGKSTGNYGAATHFDFAADGRAAYQYLRARPEVDRKRVGLLGHSEGSVYAPYIAKEEKDVAFVVLLAGIGVPTQDLLMQQSLDIMKASGIDYELTAADRADTEAIFARLAQKKLDSETAQFVREKMKQSAARQPEQLRQAMGLTDQSIEMRVRMLVSPWFVELLTYDAGKELGAIHSPVLALFGSRDTQVAAAQNTAGMKAAFDAAGNHAVTFRTFDGLNHLFQHAKTGAPAEYGTIEETMSPEVLDTVAQWIKQKR